MHRVPTADEDVLAYRTGSVSAILSVLVLLSAGSLSLGAIAIGMLRERPAIGGVLALAGVCLVVGGAVALVRSLDRSGIVLDRTRGQATAWRRLILQRSSETRELAAFWTVLLSTGRRQTRYASRTVYLVGLHGEVGEPLLLHWHEDYQQARRFAEEIAAFLGFPFTDASAVETMVHAPGQPGKAQRELAPASPPVPRAPQPVVMRCLASWHGPTLLLQEPRTGWSRLIGLPLLMFALLALPCLGLGIQSRFFGTRFPVITDPLVAAIIVVLMLLLIVLAVVLSSLPQLAPRRLVAADRGGLHFRIAGPFAVADRHIKRQDVCELRIALGHLVAVTPRDYRLICGTLDEPLTRAELEWLRDQLGRALAGDATSAQE